MAITHLHVRYLWGVLDVTVEEGRTPSYVGLTDYATLGASAVAGVGVGIRRATLRFDRTAISPADDDVLMHFDFLNLTAGLPDDTWITSDYTTLEALLNTWWGAIRGQAFTGVRLSRILWHRVGPGVVPPQVAERILDITSPLAGTGGDAVSPQDASTLTLRTAMRKHWGRTYFPIGSAIVSAGRLASASRGTLASTTVTMLQGAAAADFHPVVFSKTLESALGIEQVEVDDVVDTQRRRRWKHTVAKTLTSL